MRNMSVSCDCEGTAAEPVVTPNVGILASLDILAVDQACVDLVYAHEARGEHRLWWSGWNPATACASSPI